MIANMQSWIWNGKCVFLGWNVWAKIKKNNNKKTTEVNYPKSFITTPPPWEMFEEALQKLCIFTLDLLI